MGQSDLDSRRRLHAAIQAELDSALSGRDDLPETAVLTGWVIVCEWAGSDGTQWLTQAGSENSSTWQRRGYLHEALFAWEND